MSTINPEIIEIIKKYNNGEFYNHIENVILPKYKEDKAHDEEHIYNVINRAFALNKNLKLGLDFRILSAAIFYHDIGRSINDETHEIISAEIFMSDETMKRFFTDRERNIIKEAIEDHRASLDGEPRSIYGKLVSSSDRNTNLELPLKRTYQYRCKKNPESALEEKIRESFEHLVEKFGENGYAGTIYFDDGGYEEYLNDFRLLLDNYDLFRSEYLRVNQIDEMQYYLKNVNLELIEYVERNIFPRYSKNDSGHDIKHIKEVIRRSFELKETLKLELNDNLVYVIAACHDLGKYIDHKKHNEIAANKFFEDAYFTKFFTDVERIMIKEAIWDHRSGSGKKATEDRSLPRSKYGELISSADRNTRIEVTFQRSFAVGQDRTPDMSYASFLDYTRQRLLDRYGGENPEKMILRDYIYEQYLKEMRKVLSDAEKFNARYSEVNGVKAKDYEKPLSHFADYEQER